MKDFILGLITGTALWFIFRIYEDGKYIRDTEDYISSRESIDDLFSIGEEDLN